MFRKSKKQKNKQGKERLEDEVPVGFNVEKVDLGKFDSGEVDKGEDEGGMKTIGAIRKSKDGEGFEKRMVDLYTKGRKRGKRYSVFGIVFIFVVSLVGMIFGGRFLAQTIEMSGEAEEKIAAVGSMVIENRNSNVSEINKVPDPWRKCDYNEDCIEVRSGCCDCALGGGQDVLNMKYKDNWNKVLERKCVDFECGGLINCRGVVPICRNGICEFNELDAPTCVAEGAIYTWEEVGVDGQILKCCDELSVIKSEITGYSYCSFCGNNVCEIRESANTCGMDCVGAVVYEWNSYSSNAMGMDFRYPKGWSLREGVNNIVLNGKNKDDYLRVVKTKKAFSEVDDRVIVSKSDIEISSGWIDFRVYRNKSRSKHYIVVYLEDLSLQFSGEVEFDNLEKVAQTVLDIVATVSARSLEYMNEWNSYSSFDAGLFFGYPSTWGKVVTEVIDFSDIDSEHDVCASNGVFTKMTFSDYSDVTINRYTKDVFECNKQIDSKYLLDSDGQLIDVSLIKSCKLLKRNLGLVAKEYISENIFNCTEEEFLKFGKFLFDAVVVEEFDGKSKFLFLSSFPFVSDGNTGEIIEFIYKYPFSFEMNQSLSKMNSVDKEIMKKKIDDIKLKIKEKKLGEEAKKRYSEFLNVLSSLQDERGADEVIDVGRVDLPIDSDGDGLSDIDETKYGTNPEMEDTDGDGFLDGEEVKRGFNPNGDGLLSEVGN